MPLTVPAFTLLAAKTGASGQEKLALAFVAAFVLAWFIYVVYALSRRGPDEPVGSEMVLAPNRKAYFDDDELETNRLDRALIFALFMLVIVAVGLPLYWLNEPTRQTGALRGFNNAAVKRGAGWFASATAPTSPESPVHFGCADCHGSSGQGGSVPFIVTDPAHPLIPPRTVTWQVPPLNTVLYRFASASTSDPNAALGTALDPLRTIIIYGRPGTPMPPWGVAGGGAMNDQMINDLLAYITSIQLKPDAATKDWEARAKETAQKENVTYPSGDPLADGKVLFDTNCARCHTAGYSFGEPSVQGGGGQFAPNITNGSEKRQFPDIQSQINFVSDGVAFGKGYGQGGIATIAGGGMPHFGGYLSQAEIKMIVEYERSLP